MMDPRHIDEMLNRVNAELTAKEKQLEALILEVNKLKSAARTLEEARLILIAGRNSSAAYKVELPNASPVSLQAEVVKCLRSSHSTALSIMEIVEALKSARYPNANSKRFYSTVYITVQRLKNRGEVIEQLENGKKKYRIATNP